MGIIDEVKERTDLVQLVAESVDLETSSRNPKARCPFHSERTPSFFVFPDTDTWRCFGACSTGGDVITFVMKRDNLSFKDSLKLLAERVGISNIQESRNSHAGPSKSVVFQCNSIASKWFSSMLLASPGSQARDYLQQRGINTEVAGRRGIGYGPGDGFLTLANQLQSAKVDSRAAKESKLITQYSDGQWNDFFRNRLTLEIQDMEGNPIGFGARSLDGKEPKYLNTPNTSIFNKSKVLYGLNWARESIKQTRRAILVEGYFDVITAHEHGFNNVVATMGTSVTPQQLEILSGLLLSDTNGGEIILCLDDDEAGQEAVLRTLEVTWERFTGTSKWKRSRIAPRVLVAHNIEGKDPDEAIRSDAWAWKSSLEQSQPVIDFIMDIYSSKYDLRTGQGKAQLVETMAPLIFAEKNQFDQDKYLTKLASILDVSSERLRSMVRPGTPRISISRDKSKHFGQLNTGVAADQISTIMEGANDGIEGYFLALVIQKEELREYASSVPPEHFHDTCNREIFNLWKNSKNIELDIELSEPELQERVNNLRLRSFPPSDQIRRIAELNQCVLRLDERHLRHVLKLAEKALKEQEPILNNDEKEKLRRQTIAPTLRLKQLFIGRAH